MLPLTHMMGFTPTQMHRKVDSGGASVDDDLTTPPPPSKKHILEHDPLSSLPRPKKLREAQADTTEAKTKTIQPSVQATAQRLYHDFATLDRAGPAVITYDETDRRSFVANKHFFARISKEDSDLRTKHAAPHDYYNVELSANGLGKNRIVFVDIKATLCADPGATDHLNTNIREEDQQIRIGSALISIAETRSLDVYTWCNIVRLEIETGIPLINMEAFAVILRSIRSFCVEQHVQHLAMAPVRRSCWFSGLLEPAGFKQYECERLDKHVGVNLQLCMVLPSPPIKLSAAIGADENPLGTLSVSHRPETYAPAVAPPASRAVTPPAASRALARPA